MCLFCSESMLTDTQVPKLNSQPYVTRFAKQAYCEHVQCVFISPGHKIISSVDILPHLQLPKLTYLSTISFNVCPKQAAVSAQSPLSWVLLEFP